MWFELNSVHRDTRAPHTTYESSALRPRSRLIGTTILVDASHPDFTDRYRHSRQGTPKVDERLCGYLATIVSCHYRERVFQAISERRVDCAQAYERMIATYCRLEDALRVMLPRLLRDMNVTMAAPPGGITGPKDTEEAGRGKRADVGSGFT